MTGNQNSGRKPKPASYRELMGQHVSSSEPVPSTGDVLVPPYEMNEAEREVWDRLAPDMVKHRVLTPWDVDRFAAFCSAVVMMNDARASLDNYGLDVVTVDREMSDGTIVYKTIKNPALDLFVKSVEIMNKIGASYGLSPADRSRIQLNDDRPTEDKTAKYL